MVSLVGPQTNTLQVNLMKHDPIDLIYNFILSKALLIHRRGCGNSTYTAYSIANSVTWSPTGYAYPAESHAHYIMQI